MNVGGQLSFFENGNQLAPPVVERVNLPAGGFLLRNPTPLQPYARCIGAWLEHWAQARPDTLAFAEPAAQGGWRGLSWRELRAQVGSVAQGLLDLRLAANQPIAVLSDNALDHAVMLLAGMHIGLSVCTVSSAYSRLAAGDYSRIHGILRTLQPSLIYASDAATYGAAASVPNLAAQRVFSTGAEQLAGAISFAQLQASQESPAVQAAFSRITAQTHAKYLLTSGSTGHPKIVINTHQMLCANQQMIRQTLRFLEQQPPVLLDWLPWSHTFGGNHNMNMVLAHGGTLYIDDGRPVPGLIDKTIAHLRQVSPTLYFNVPRGFEFMLPALEADEALARRFLAGLKMLFYAGAGMPQSTWDRLAALARKLRDEPLWMTTSWGSTETAPGNTFANWHLDRPGVIGLPMPGVTIKFVPNGNKLEMRCGGEHIFPGYRNDEAATRAAFDDEGYYKIGDAGYLLDESNPARGIVFNGRVAEDFKLTSGTWVSVGTLRLKLVAALAPYAQDVVITGHEQAEAGCLIFLTEAARKQPRAEVSAQLLQALRALKAQGAGSAQTVTRALILNDAPNMAAGEITDKGYINQRQVLTRRAADVQRLYGPGADADADIVVP